MSVERTGQLLVVMVGRRLAGALAVLAMVATVGVRPSSAEWTFGAFVGGTRTQDTWVRLFQAAPSTDVTLTPVHYRSESFDPPIYYGYRVGLFPASGWLGLEGEFIHLKVTADTARLATVEGVWRGSPMSGARRVDSVLERFSISHGVNLVLVNAVVRRFVGEHQRKPRWILTGRLGGGASVPHPESTIAGERLDVYEWGSLSLQAAGGVELHVGKQVYVTSEYKLTRTVQDVSVVSGSARTPLTSHHFVAGITAHVGSLPLRQ